MTASATLENYTTLTDVTLVPTPGHIVGHVSVIVRDDDLTYLCRRGCHLRKKTT